MKNRKVAYRALFLMLSASIVVACSKDDKPSQINPTTSQKVVVKNFEQKTSTEVSQPDMFSGTLNQDIKDQLFNELPLFGGGKDVENAQHDLEVALNRTYSKIEPGMEDFGSTSFSINASLIDGLLPNLEETRVITEAAIALTNVILNASEPARIMAIDVLADPIDAANAVFEIVVYTVRPLIGGGIIDFKPCTFREPGVTTYDGGARTIQTFWNGCGVRSIYIPDEIIVDYTWDLALESQPYLEKKLYSTLPGINEPFQMFNNVLGSGFTNDRWNFWYSRFSTQTAAAPPVLTPPLEQGQSFNSVVLESENAFDFSSNANYHKTRIIYTKGRFL